MTYTPLLPAQFNAIELPELEFLIDGIVPKGAFAELVAREKSGKSLALIDMAVSIASGEPFLDRAVTQGPTALITMEDNLREARARLNARLNGLDDTPAYLLACDGSIPDQKFSFEDGTSLTDLQEMIETYDLVFVGIDPLREAHSRAENDSDDMSPLLRAPRQIAHATNCTILVTHHESKGGSSRGSTSIDAAFDQILSLKLEDPAADELAGKLSIKGRYGPRQSIRARFGDHGRWRLDTSVITPSNTRERIIEYLGTSGDWHTADAIHTGIGDSLSTLKTIQNYLGELLRADLVIRRGLGKRGDPFTYAVTGTQTLFPKGSGNNREQSESLFPNPSGTNGSNPKNPSNHADVFIPETKTPRGTAFGNKPETGKNARLRRRCDSRFEGDQCPNCGTPARMVTPPEPVAADELAGWQ